MASAGCFGMLHEESINLNVDDCSSRQPNFSSRFDIFPSCFGEGAAPRRRFADGSGSGTGLFLRDGGILAFSADEDPADQTRVRYEQRKCKHHDRHKNVGDRFEIEFRCLC